MYTCPPTVTVPTTAIFHIYFFTFVLSWNLQPCILWAKEIVFHTAKSLPYSTNLWCPDRGHHSTSFVGTLCSPVFCVFGNKEMSLLLRKPLFKIVQSCRHPMNHPSHSLYLPHSTEVGLLQARVQFFNTIIIITVSPMTEGCIKHTEMYCVNSLNS